jgi:NAD+ synthase (glutamine-hydrolysing)
VKVALCQIDTRVGDLPGNAARVLAAHRAAASAGADLSIFPELVVTGYPPRDLLLDDAFVDAAIAATERIASEAADLPPLVVGSIARAPSRTPLHPGLVNVAAVLEGGRVRETIAKRLLPVYDVFLEPRWFVPGPPSVSVEVAGAKVGLLVCEDLWDEGYPESPGDDLVAAGAETLVCIAASPFRAGVYERRFTLAGRHGVPLVFVNHVGATDELIFDGGSFVADATGRVVEALPRFSESVTIVDLARDLDAPVDVPRASEAEELFRALVLGVRDFALKNGSRHAWLGLSGGVDSALVACIAREALGPDKVTGVALPSRFSDPRSTETAAELARALGIGFEVRELEPLHAAAETALADLLAGERGEVAAENVQARLRALVLMALVNARGGMLLNTSNKTELALGYGTLYGDMAGTLAVLGDLTKPQVYDVARWYDGGRGTIPAFILERPPSAELKADQVDPFDYPRVSPVVEALVTNTPVPPGTPDDEVTRYRRLIRAAEHKRWQAGIVLKVSEKAFGTGRLIPVTRV